MSKDVITFYVNKANYLFLWCILVSEQNYCYNILYNNKILDHFINYVFRSMSQTDLPAEGIIKESLAS